MLKTRLWIVLKVFLHIVFKEGCEMGKGFQVGPFFHLCCMGTCFVSLDIENQAVFYSKGVETLLKLIRNKTRREWLNRRGRHWKMLWICVQFPSCFLMNSQSLGSFYVIFEHQYIYESEEEAIQTTKVFFFHVSF